MQLASDQHLYLRLDEYFKLLLRFHKPKPKTFHILLAAHSAAGHTERVKEIILRMQEGSGAEVADQLPPADAPGASSGALLDPTDGSLKAAKKVARNADIKFAFDQRVLYHLIRCHAINNDTEEILKLLTALRQKENLYPLQVADLSLNLALAELLMHYFSVHRLLAESVQLIRWMQVEQLPLSVELAWGFFEGFKREVAMRDLHTAAANPEQAASANQQIQFELNRRRKKEPAVAPKVTQLSAEQAAAAESQKKKFDATALPTVPMVRELLPFPQDGKPNAIKPIIRSPFPPEADGTSLFIPSGQTYPQSAVRQASRLTSSKPSPLDRNNERVDFRAVLNILLHEQAFVPSEALINAYIGYYGLNFYPPTIFPDVMMSQVNLFQQQITEETIKQIPANSALIVATTPSSKDAAVLEARTPFLPTAQTYALLIQALMDRKPIKGASPASIALHKPGPSLPDQRSIARLRSEMRARHIEPLLQTKVVMMQLMVYDEKWSDLYAAFSLLWKADKLRRDGELAKMRADTKGAAAVAAAAAGVKEAEETKDDEDLSPSVSVPLASSAAPFDCMSLVPVFTALSHRPSLDRLNLFLGIVTSTKDFALTQDFFQSILQILADRGRTSDIIALLRVMDRKYGIKASGDQFNTMLASLVHTDAALATSEQQSSGVVSLPKRDPQRVMVSLFQAWELMKMLGLSMNPHTYTILMRGCLHFGALIDGERVWAFVNLRTTRRPSLALYTLYIEFLLKHAQMKTALDVMRSQSFKDGLDYSLRQCYILLDYFQTKLLRHAEGSGVHRLARQTPVATRKMRKAMLNEDGSTVEDEVDFSAESAAGSDLTDAQAAAVYVPTEIQVAMYAEIKRRSESLMNQLLAFEKRGGVLSGRSGFLDVSTSMHPTPPMTKVHRRHVSPQLRTLSLTLEEKENDEVLELSTIPPKVFGREMVPLLALVAQFLGPSTKKNKQGASPKLLDSPDAAESPDAAAAAGDFVLDPVDAQEVNEATNLFVDRSPVYAEEVVDVDVEPQPQDAEETARVAQQAEDIMQQMANDLEAQEQQMEAAKEAAAAAAAAVSAPVQSTQLPLAATSVAVAASPSSSTPVFVAMDAALRQLFGHAKKTWSPLAETPVPSHPAMLGDVDLCALRAADKIGQLTIPQLKAVQTHPQLMKQSRVLVQGIKSHHLLVVNTWLDHCTCAKHH